jgi:hypothetical protein
MTPPEIDHSTRQEREAFIIEEFRCLGDCDNCGHCQILHSRDALEVYKDYIEGTRSFRDITLEMRY